MEKKKDVINKKQIISLPVSEIINSIVTLKEASEMLGVAESTLRTRVLKGEFDKWEFRKSGGTIIFSKIAIESRIGNFRKRL